ncbi:MAG: hypothetical protein PVG27_14280 [Chloroflexota bacterium]|jgi:hypothetical protein
MRGHAHARTRRLVIITAGALLLGSLPASVSAGGERTASLPPCGEPETVDEEHGTLVTPWQTVLDADGAVTGHRLVLRHDGRERVLRTGRRGFAMRVSARHLLIGERHAEGTRLDLIDLRHGCRRWTRVLDAHAYPGRDGGPGRIRLALHDRATRAYLEDRVLEAATGATEASLQEGCLEGCHASDGELGPAALEPAGAARPTPEFAAGGWAKDRTLAFRWRPGAAPPSWARRPMKAAAEDASGTAYARSPHFPYRSEAHNAMAYTGAMPAFCSQRAIACAGRSMPTTWGVWIRPHGTDFAWGTLRWCQKTSSSSGCFDLRRVALHELGHITGLDHPSSAGFTLSYADSVMQGITPARPYAGASRHAFGRCDVATLQELYDTPDNKTSISTCNDVATTLALSASNTSVPRGTSVTLTAQLKVDGRSAYRQLADNPLNGRSVKLKYRPAGSDGPWQTAWLRPLYSSGRYRLSITPSATWEFKAVFPAPGDEGLRYSRSPLRKVRVVE